jgi:hypothetical protein
LGATERGIRANTQAQAGPLRRFRRDRDKDVDEDDRDYDDAEAGERSR